MAADMNTARPLSITPDAKTSNHRVRNPRTVADRFWSKVDKTGDCWLWTGCLSKTGYGWFGVGKHVRLAHRVAWALTKGPIPEGLHVLHERHCPNHHCVRHVYLGSHTDNMRDLVAVGNHNHAKKTHCLRGHPLFGENLYVEVHAMGQRRHCRTCVRARVHAWRLAHPERKR